MFLLVLCAFTGVVMVLGGLWLVSKGKILIDSATGKPIEVQLPLKQMKLRGLTPALVFFGLACAMVAIPVYCVYRQPQANITGEVVAAGGTTLLVYVAVDPAVVEGQATAFSLRVPFNSAVGAYDVLYVANRQVLSHLRVPAPGAAGATVKIDKTVEIQ